jgi:hypothetical protein
MTTTYRLCPRVKWVVERFTLRVTDGSGALRTFDYPEAAVWDLMSRGYPFAQVVSMTGHIMSVGAETADTLVRRSLEQWAASGLIEPL